MSASESGILVDPLSGVLGALALADRPRETAKEALSLLRRQGIALVRQLGGPDLAPLLVHHLLVVAVPEALGFP